MSQCHSVTASQCHSVTVSQCHSVTFSPGLMSVYQTVTVCVTVLPPGKLPTNRSHSKGHNTQHNTEHTQSIQSTQRQFQPQGFREGQAGNLLVMQVSSQIGMPSLKKQECIHSIGPSTAPSPPNPPQPPPPDAHKGHLCSISSVKELKMINMKKSI